MLRNHSIISLVVDNENIKGFMSDMLRSRRAFAVSLISIVLLTDISGCLDYDEPDYGGPAFVYGVRIPNTNSSGYVIVPFPYNKDDHEKPTNITLNDLQNITSYSIEFTIYGIGLNISFTGSFGVYYEEIVSPDDFRISGENSMSLRDEMNSTKHRQYSWIYYHGDSEGIWFYSGYHYVLREESESSRYGTRYSIDVGLQLINGWQKGEYRADSIAL